MGNIRESAGSRKGKGMVDRVIVDCPAGEAEILIDDIGQVILRRFDLDETKNYYRMEPYPPSHWLPSNYPNNGG